MNKVVLGMGALLVIIGISYFSASGNNSAVVTRDAIVGSWRSVVTNPAYKNSVARKYMKHSFSPDGTLTVQNEDSSNQTWEWVFENGVFVSTRTYNTSVFTTTYEFISTDELKMIRFQSLVDGKPVADYVPEDWFIREGSRIEKQMEIVDIF